MIDYDKIQKGDCVSVNFHGSQFTLCRKAIVLNIPASTGESWKFKDFDDHKIHYVSEGCTVTLIQKEFKKGEN